MSQFNVSDFQSINILYNIWVFQQSPNNRCTPFHHSKKKKKKYPGFPPVKRNGCILNEGEAHTRPSSGTPIRCWENGQLPVLTQKVPNSFSHALSQEPYQIKNAVLLPHLCQTGPKPHIPTYNKFKSVVDDELISNIGRFSHR